jgi:hypothetical protein
MPKSRKPRDHGAEYARRVQRLLAQGYTRSQARGHPKATEAPLSTRKSPKPLEEARLQHALKELRSKGSLSGAAKAARISPERLRAAALSKGAIEKKGRRWTVKADLPRRVLIYSEGREYTPTVGSFDEASHAGKYIDAVGDFWTTADASHLDEFIGTFVTDINGRAYPLETNPNALFRLRKLTRTSFEEVYRIVV